MAKVDEYREALRALDEWDEYLLAHSGLPGPRGNLELARAVALEGDLSRFRRYAAYNAGTAPANSAYEFLAFCGVLGMGRLLADGSAHLVPELRIHASDPRWRTREAAAMAVQWWAGSDMHSALAEMRSWASGNLLEQRAAVAGLCEPSLLREPEHAAVVLAILDEVTAGLAEAKHRRSEEFRVLRKALGYCWSVAVAAQPEIGKPALSRWLGSADKDVQWILRENLKKKRLTRMDEAWVACASAHIGEPTPAG